jgi:hypothetical protein
MRDMTAAVFTLILRLLAPALGAVFAVVLAGVVWLAAAVVRGVRRGLRGGSD